MPWCPFMFLFLTIKKKKYPQRKRFLVADHVKNEFSIIPHPSLIHFLFLKKTHEREFLGNLIADVNDENSQVKKKGLLSGRTVEIVQFMALKSLLQLKDCTRFELIKSRELRDYCR